MQKGKAKKIRYASYIFRIAIAVVALYLTFRGEDFGKIVDVLLELRWWVFAVAMGIWAFSQVIFVARWSVLLRVQSVSIGYWPAFRLHLLGVFYNNCLPTSVGGDLLRAWYVTTHTDKKLEAALSVFVDRIIGLIGMIIMALFCYWFIPAQGQQPHLRFSFDFKLLSLLSEYRWVFLAIVVGLAFILLALAWSPKGSELLRRLFAAIRARGQAVRRKTHEALRLYCRHTLALVLALFLTFCCQAVFILGLWLIGREIGIGVHIKYYFVFFPIAWMLGALPISIGALGVWEGVLKLLFAQVATGIGERLSALALSHRLIWLFGSLPGLIIHLIGAHLPRDFFIDYEKSIN
jgi:hypothetical protein